MDYVAGRRSTKLIFARFTSMRILWNVELDDGDNNGDNIDTSILILNENEDGGLAGLGWRYPCLLPGNLCKEATRRFY